MAQFARLRWLLAALALSACGQKGPLILPQPETAPPPAAEPMK